ncbi:hypothetical protein ACKUSY_16285 [Myroides odoratus]
MIDNLDIKVQVVIISSVTSVLIFLVGWLFKFIYERYSLSYKLNKEFEFEQKKKLKEEIAKNKIHLINSIEALNHRMWNFSQNVDKDWHKRTEDNWFKDEEQYYINSFLYRFLCFIHWTLKTENDTVSVDTTIASKDDVTFLKWIKTFKDIFTDTDLLKEFEYDKSKNSNHFYKNDLIGYTKILVKNDKILDFDEFETELKDNYTNLKKVIEYFTSIENDNNDKNLNVLRCFHLLTIKFLNDYGHDYQHTNKKKLIAITELYKSKIIIKRSFIEFIKKSKLEKEMRSIINKIK